MEISEGDFVRFRSGSPIMIVGRIIEKSCYCKWFTLNGKYNVEKFDLDDLEKVDEKKIEIAKNLFNRANLLVLDNDNG